MSWRGTRSGRTSRSRRDAGSTPRSSRRCWPRAPIPPTSCTTRRQPVRKTSSPSTRSWQHGARRRSSRIERRTRTSGALRTSQSVYRCPSGRRCWRSWRSRHTRSAGSMTPFRRSSTRLRSLESSATTRPSAVASESCRATTGSPATVTPRARRRSKRSRFSSRSARRSSSRVPTASSLSWRCWRRTPSPRARGESGRWSSRPGLATSGRVHTRLSTLAPSGST